MNTNTLPHPASGYYWHLTLGFGMVTVAIMTTPYYDPKSVVEETYVYFLPDDKNNRSGVQEDIVSAATVMASAFAPWNPEATGVFNKIKDELLASGNLVW